MRHSLKTQQWVPYPLPTVFNFFVNPANLPPLMPRWQRARVEQVHLQPPGAPPADRPGSRRPVAGAGSRILISFRPVPLLPIRLRWDARIVEFAWDEHFCDEQTAGPFAYWRHCHRVREETRAGVRGTSITDEVTFALPLGRLGELACSFGGMRQVRWIFHYRQEQLVELLSASTH